MPGMLVLRRYEGESIVIDGGIEIKVLGANGQVALGFIAPKETKILRSELLADETQAPEE